MAPAPASWTARRQFDPEDKRELLRVQDYWFAN
jgi:hypothetical protein